MMGLSKQRESRSVTPEERVQGWYNMWDVLFPGHARPASIYHENSELSERVAEARETFFAGGRVATRIDALLHDGSSPMPPTFVDAGGLREFVYRCVAALFDDFESHLAGDTAAGSSRSRSPRSSGPEGGAGAVFSAGFAPAPAVDPFLTAHSGASSYLSPSPQVSGWQWPSPNVHSVSAASVMGHDSVDNLSLDAGPASYGWLSSHQGQQVDPGTLMTEPGLGYNAAGDLSMGYHGYSFSSQQIEDDYE